LLTTHALFFSYSIHHRDLPSFPTRRSSDLGPADDIGNGLDEQDAKPIGRLATAVAEPERQKEEERRIGDEGGAEGPPERRLAMLDRKSTRLNSSHRTISYAVFCLKKKTKQH